MSSSGKTTIFSGLLDTNRQTYDFFNHYAKTLAILNAVGLKPTVINHRGATGEIWFEYKGSSQSAFTAANLNFAGILAYAFSEISKLGVQYYGTFDLVTTSANKSMLIKQKFNVYQSELWMDSINGSPIRVIIPTNRCSLSLNPIVRNHYSDDIDFHIEGWN